MEPRSYLADTRVKKAVAASLVGPDAELVHDEDLGGQVDAHASVRLFSARAFLKSSIRS